MYILLCEELRQYYSSFKKSQNSSNINLKSNPCPICAHIYRKRKCLRTYRRYSDQPMIINPLTHLDTPTHEKMSRRMLMQIYIQMYIHVYICKDIICIIMNIYTHNMYVCILSCMHHYIIPDLHLWYQAGGRSPHLPTVKSWAFSSPGFTSKGSTLIDLVFLSRLSWPICVF